MFRPSGSNQSFVAGYHLGQLIDHDETREIYDLPEIQGHILILSKYRSKYLDSVKVNLLHQLAEVFGDLNHKVYTLLNNVGVETYYVKQCTKTSYIAKNCKLVPLKFVTRRYAAGSAFLFRRPDLEDGQRFAPLQQETMYEDETCSDYVLNDKTILEMNMIANELKIGVKEMEIMRRTAYLIFEFLEKAWATRFFSLVDMKIEFGIHSDGSILVADTFNSNSFRLRTLPDQHLLIDRHINKDLINAGSDDLKLLLDSFMYISMHLSHIIKAMPKAEQLVVILMSAGSDTLHCGKISLECEKLGLNTKMHVVSELENHDNIACIMHEYENSISEIVFIVVASAINSLGKVSAERLTTPVINCPPAAHLKLDQSSCYCPTILYPQAAAVNAALILGSTNFDIWAKLRFSQLNYFISLYRTNKGLTD